MASSIHSRRRSTSNTPELLVLGELFDTLVQKSLIRKPSASSGNNEADDKFQTISDEILKASSTGDSNFIRSVVDFCDHQSILEDGVRLWQRLRSVNGKDGYGPLHRAVTMGFPAIVNLLVTGKVEGETLKLWPPFHPLEFSDFDFLHARTPEGWTSLHLAAMATDENENVLELLIKLYDATPQPDEDTWDFADNLWLTPLHYAVLANRQTQVQQLLNCRTYQRHVNAGDFHQKTPLHMAVCYQKVSPYPESLRGSSRNSRKIQVNKPRIALINFFAENPNVDFQAVDCCLYTPLHWAVHVGNTEAVRYLVSLTDERRIRATEKDIKGRPPLQIAIETSAIAEDAEEFDQLAHGEYFNWSPGNMMDKPANNQKVFKDIEQLLFGHDDVKDEVERLYRDRQVYADATNAIIVGSTLVASVTFSGWLQPPDGDNSKEANGWVRMFWNTNSLAFYAAVAAVMAGGRAVLPLGNRPRVYIGRSVEILRWKLALTANLFVLAAIQVLQAFAAAGYASLTTGPPRLKKRMTITTIIGGSVCGIMFISFVRGVVKLGAGLAEIVRQTRPALLFLARDIDRHFQPFRARTQGDPALEAIRTNLKHAWSRSWGPAGGENGGPAEQETEIENLLDKAFKQQEGTVQSQSKTVRWRKHDCERQLQALVRVYEVVRREMTKGNALEQWQHNRNLRFLAGHGLRPRAIHHWMSTCPVALCRAHSLKQDIERLKCFRHRLEAQHEKYSPVRYSDPNLR